MRLRYWCSSCEGLEGVGVESCFEVLPLVVGASFFCEEGSVEEITGCRFVEAILCAV